MSRFLAGMPILAALAGWAAVANADTVTVGTNGAPGATYHSIQAAIDALDNVNPAGDPNFCHTILIQPGTYSRGVEETNSFYQHYRATGWPNDDGRGPIDGGRTHSKSLIVVNDVDEDFEGDGSTNSYLNGLHIIGAGSDQTIIDAKGRDGSDKGGRVMFVKNDNVYIQGITLKGARMVSGEAWSFWLGSGLLCHGTNVILKDIKVEDCDMQVGNGWNCVNLRAPGAALIERMEITGFDNQGSALWVGAANNVLIANCRVHDNRSNGIVIDSSTRYGVIYGCLATSNTAAGIVVGWNCDYNYVVNCTSASNGTGYAAGDWTDEDKVLNCIFTGNTAAYSSSGGNTYFLNCNIDQPDFLFGGTRVDGYGTVSPTAGTNPRGSADLNPNYSLKTASPGFDAGRTVDAGTYKYVDLGNDGSYDEGIDIVVAGTPPSDPDKDDRVWLIDLAGNRRVRVKSIDMGACEYQPPRGTVVMMK